MADNTGAGPLSSQQFTHFTKDVAHEHPTNASGGSTTQPRYAADEQQPESATNERAALAEREDGTIRAGTLPKDFPGGAPADAVPIIQLTADEQQSIEEVAEYRAL